MDINAKYQPLFSEPDTRYTLVKGGRGSGKSFALSASLCNDTFNDGYRILFARYSMTSAEISIIPEYREKIQMFGYDELFEVRQASIRNKTTGGEILFRGIMASSGNQIARLKSIHNVRRFVLDEAQELMDESMFETIDFSIRMVGAKNNITIVLNPTDINHWIYRRFYKDVPEGFNGVHDGVRYISTTYKDNIYNLDPSVIDQARRMRDIDEERYRNVWEGEWVTNAEGVIFKNWREIERTDIPMGLHTFYGVDWGYSNDPTAVVCCYYDAVEKAIYLREVCYQKEMLAAHVAQVLRQDMKENGINPDTDVYCDPARPEHIAELRMNNLVALGADNRNKAGRIMYLKYFSVNYVGKNIGKEVATWSWKRDKHSDKEWQNVPEDGNDHLMDASLYGCVTWLRRMGETNTIGER